MKEKKLQVFVSSTYTDLKEERQAAVEAILSSGHIPAGMELFSAGDESQLSVIKRWIDDSDVYLLIFGGRYGSVEPKSGKSYTQLEYEYALETKKPLFSVVISDAALERKVKTEGTAVIERTNNKLLLDFRAIVLGNLVKFWDDKKDIKIAIHETISEFSYRKELIGWIRGDNSINAGPLAEEMARLGKDNSELREKLNAAKMNESSLYSGLTFKQLEGLLKREFFEIEGRKLDLYEFLMMIGNSIVHYGIFNGDYIKGADRLAFYKIFTKPEFGGSIYYWSDDGQNFFLKTLVLSLENTG